MTSIEASSYLQSDIQHDMTFELTINTWLHSSECRFYRYKQQKPLTTFWETKQNKNFRPLEIELNTTMIPLEI